MTNASLANEPTEAQIDAAACTPASKGHPMLTPEQIEAASPEQAREVLEKAFQELRPMPLQTVPDNEFARWAIFQTKFRAMLDCGAFVDAALMLVGEGWRLQLSDWDDPTLRARGPWQAILTRPGKRDDFGEWPPRCDHANHPALAIVSAIYRAKETGDG